MNSRTLLGLVALTATLGGMQLASAATLIPVVPVPGSLQTTVFGINDNNIIVGSYLDTQGVEHGFFGSLDGNYTTLDYTENPVQATEPRGINNDGYITGWALFNNFNDAYEFVRNPNGSIATVTKDGVPLEGLAQGITTNAVFVGNYFTFNPLVDHAYEGQDGQYVADVSPLPFNTGSAARGINSFGDIVGHFRDAAHVRHGFLVRGGVATQIDYPGSSDTSLEGINDKGIATGTWRPRQGPFFSFVLDTNTNKFTPLNLGVNEAFGLNNSGLIALNLIANHGSVAGPYIYCPVSPQQCPHSPGAIRIADPTPIKVRPDNFKPYVVTKAGMNTPYGRKHQMEPIRTPGPPGTIEP